ncbi:thiol-disulfide isomerase/thioredoxin [Halarchaeum rubridurum]|uniref:Thiol-disulfide isomerase/thioredoxin n=1 Tax=Halarchaeum rubridurum TaxID=489911 RepID=A0A830FPQ4_9EURY|nr:glutaredoxin family protein [Halarchaeum rubridurum]MBP1954253.1 thiol-disulfide isomerase/thioredoxin [Halarchaeum rubridurum]GGM58538.1 thioredoxin family protein [Halarchaeum rubridurum]
MSVAITVYRREECHLCDEAERTIDDVVDDLDVPVNVTTRDVDADPELEAEYGERVPYVEVEGGVTFEHRVEASRLRRAIMDAA